jgi:Concanavalin A-like lectin/glucanases superfamily
VTERFCLRCDWRGETDEHACPRCGAPLYRMDSEPAPARQAPAPAGSEAPPEAAGTRREHAGKDEELGDEVPPPVHNAERGRWRVIALALALTAVVAFVLTRGGEPDPASPGQDEQAAGQPSGASAATTPLPILLAPCSGDRRPPPPPEPGEAAPAATADYLFQDSLESSLGTAPDLVEVEDGSAVFTADLGTGVTVLRFAGGRGLALSPTTGVVPSSEYTIEVLFRFDFLSKDRKVIDFKNGSTDDGLYVHEGCLNFFPKELGALTRIGTDSYVQVVLTRDSTDRVVAYVNGVRQFAFTDRTGVAEVSGRGTLRFFADDRTTIGEWSSGAVSQIRLFDQPLTANEVEALACSEVLIAHATVSCRDL